MSLPELIAVSDPTALDAGGAWDAVVVVAPGPVETGWAAVDRLLSAQRAVDRRLDHDVQLLGAPGLAGGRLVVSPVSSVRRDHDDPRRFGESARAGVRRAAAAGATRPLLVVTGIPKAAAWERAGSVAALEALSASWAPLEAREARGDGAVETVAALGWLTQETNPTVEALGAIEGGRRIARDITGTEPERMAPLRLAELCQDVFRAGPVAVEVVDQRPVLERDYPLLSAVGRASWPVARHAPCVVRLRYEGEGPLERTLLLAGKGVTYDTGGADVKFGGAMAGMSRDKGGAGAVAGIMAYLARARPRGLRVVAEIGAVRNSIGAEGFVTDEIIESHAGVRVRIGNTDAEGRLVLADLLSHLRVAALTCPNPHLFTMATLTGHVGRAVGPYTAALDNGPARALRTADRLAEAGDRWGEPVEVSRLRREDWDFVRPRTSADDVLSCNNAASSVTPRGHQFPMAFLAVASGLDRHGSEAQTPLPFTHVDVGGSAVENGDWQHGRPTGTPLVAFTAALLGLE
ncbi:MAG: leucyl aminopeptidase family protein [Myxococcota bacterium]